MSDLRDAAQQALEALEDSCAPRLSTKHYAAYDEAITALRAALEHAVSDERFAALVAEQERNHE